MSTRSIAVRLRSLKIPSSWKGWQTYERTRAEAANWEDLPLVLRIEGLMDLLSIGRNSAYTLVNSGTIQCIRVGNLVRIPRQCVMPHLIVKPAAKRKPWGGAPHGDRPLLIRRTKRRDSGTPNTLR